MKRTVEMTKQLPPDLHKPPKFKGFKPRKNRTREELNETPAERLVREVKEWDPTSNP